ncbi:MAG: DUF488 domain-containing protein [Candidatus Cloacimonetes bacterium]|jgi:uncharacterized protein (DUF488 family)|nr:DUF488 domain-containing protein [Candidatus Cloacimonadota bacterium]MDY0171494.1 DUF488 domain-containing protein [Candidatus Cloacimonadaceae bacterium]
MKLYTIGFTQKTAEQFFALLKGAKVKTVWDLRLKNHSQLAAFSKYPDLVYFLDQLLGVRYAHFLEMSPSLELMQAWHKDEFKWDHFRKTFLEIMASRDIEKLIKAEWPKAQKPICLLCSEEKADMCHRSLIAEIIKKLYPKTEIINL